ncbi:MAG: tRNA 2-thiocytidine biosynthesis TtcA family protein [Acidilobus sp.]|nr:tRNA 2-thiocytidine biosynthesis TtcA family protein [Acidilobus sp.]
MAVLLDGAAVKVYSEPKGRCIKCGRPARVRLLYARAWLCDEHFLEYLREKVARGLTRYGMTRKGDKVVVAVSGGKDSMTLMDVLSHLSTRLGIELIAVHINLGIGDFSQQSLSAFREACKRYQGVKCLELDLKELTGFYLPDLLKAVRRPACSVCGLVRRYILNALAVELGASEVATGHHMNDIMAYAIKNFLGQNLEQIPKLGPVVEGEESAVRRIRPLFDVYEDETRAYVIIGGVPYTSAVCPFKPRDSMEDVIKWMLETIERRSPSLLISSARKMAESLESYPRSERPMGRCKYCGMPTSREVCSFCSLTQAIAGRPLGPEVRSKIRDIAAKLALMR